MNPTRSTSYRCDICAALHSEEKDAQTCCAPLATIVDTWVCAECGYETEHEDSARHCCLDDDIVLPATPAQLEAAGQRRLPL